MDKRNWIDRSAWIAEQMYPRIAARSGYPNIARADASDPTASLEAPHMLYMCLQLVAKGLGSETKACRWLGWLQAAAAAKGYYTLQELTLLNMASGNNREVP